MNWDSKEAVQALADQGVISEAELHDMRARVQYINSDLDKVHADALANLTVTTTARHGESMMYVHPNKFIGDSIAATPTEKQGWSRVNPYATPEAEEYLELQRFKEAARKPSVEIDILKELLSKEKKNTEHAIASINPFDLIKQRIAAMPKVTNSESQKRALALLLMEKLMKLLGI